MPLKIAGTVKTDGRPITNVRVNVKIGDDEFEIQTTASGIDYLDKSRDFDGRTAIGTLPDYPALRAQEKTVTRSEVRFDFVIDRPGPTALLRFLSRLGGSLLLRSDTYQRIKANSGAKSANEITVQGLLVAALGCLAFGAASPGVWVFDDQVVPPRLAVALGLGVSMLVAWFVGAAIAYVVGTKLLPAAGSGGSIDFATHLRTVGFAAAPLLLAIFTPLLLLASISVGRLGFVLIMLWALVAAVVATRQSLGYGAQWLRAIGVAAVGITVVVVVVAVVWRMVGAQ